jgi:hypothetical protein
VVTELVVILTYRHYVVIEASDDINVSLPIANQQL